MRSTGEVMGISDNFGASIAKSQIAASNTLPTDGTVFFSVNDNDKTEMTLDIARDLQDAGFSLNRDGRNSGHFSMQMEFRANEYLK